jgi:hypothetical protein
VNREQLEEIRARAEAATEGPWYYGGDTRVAQEMFQNHELIVSPTYPIIEFEPSEQGEADAEFAAAARTDVPALLDEIDRLNKRLDKTHDDLTRIHDGDDDSFTTLESTVEYVVHSYRALEKDFNELWELSGGLPLPTAATAEGSAEGGTSKGSSGEEKP